MSIEVKRFLELGLTTIDENDLDLKEGLKAIEVSVVTAENAVGPGILAVPLSSLCTSACFSTISSVTTSVINDNPVPEKELRSLVGIHTKAIQAVGQEAFVDAARKLMKDAPKEFLEMKKAK